MTLHPAGLLLAYTLVLKKKQFEPFGDVDLGILVAADMRPLAVTTLGWRIPDVYTTMLLLEGHLLGSRCLISRDATVPPKKRPLIAQLEK